MGAREGLKLLSVGVCFALLLACDEQDQAPALQWPVGVGGGAATPPAVGGAAGSAGAPSGCASDPLPVPVPSVLAGDISTPMLSDGCGKAYACASGTRSLLTKGSKDPDCVDELNGVPKCGPWSARRDFDVVLPQDYDPQKPYALVIQTPPCGGTLLDVDTLARGDGAYVAPNYSFIRVGVSPGPSATGYPVPTTEDCFDDEEGDDSIDWVFYENLYDKLNAELCFDRRHVFVSAAYSGGQIANELGCKYAGDAVRPVRGVFVVNGEVPAEAKYLPTCSQAPLAGMWVHQLNINNVGTPFESVKSIITRAMPLDQCPGGDYDHAQLENFPIGGGYADDTCQRIVGCDPLNPLVVCPLPGNNKVIPEGLIGWGFSAFITQFGIPPVL